LKYGVAVNNRNKDDETALHLAIRCSRFKLAGILLEHGADVHAKNKNGQTPLRILSESWSHDNGDFVNHAKSFLFHTMGVNLHDEDNKTSLLVGIGGGKYELTEIITDVSADASMEKNMGHIKGDMAVRQASRGSSGSESREREHGLSLALESSADLNVQEDNQMTLTYLQYNPGPFQIAVLLLYYGVNENIGNNGGESPRYQEIKGEYYIRQYHTMFNKFNVLAVNVQDQNQLTPLHLASLYGWVEMARVLLDRGANVNSEDNLGQTPLHMASLGAISQEDGICIAQLLLERGADLHAQDHNYATPLDFALHHGKLKIKSLLLRHGDKANAKIKGSTRRQNTRVRSGGLVCGPAKRTRYM
jgi:ankyrin repeat protein